jgi:hypothetical protein
MKIRPLGAQLFYAEKWTDMKLKDAFRNFSNAPKNTFHKVNYSLCSDSKMWKKVSSSNEILQKGERSSHRREGLNDPHVVETVKNLAQGL